MEKRKTRMVLCDQRDINAIMRSRKIRHYEYVLHCCVQRVKNWFAYHFYYDLEVAEMRFFALLSLLGLAIYSKTQAPLLTMSQEDCEERGLMLLFGIFLVIAIALPPKFISDEK